MKCARHDIIKVHSMDMFRLTSSSAMTERPRKACYVFDACPALFAKSQNCIFSLCYRASRTIPVLYIRVLMQRNIVAEFHQ